MRWLEAEGGGRRVSWPQGRGAGCPRLLLGGGSAQVSISPRLAQKGSKEVHSPTPQHEV